MQDIVQPYGITKRPPESTLTTFTENCQNLEAAVIVAILFYVVQDEGTAVISKVRACYTLEKLFKIRKYFDCGKHNLEKFRELDFEDVRASSASDYNLLSGLRTQIVDALSKNFEDNEVKERIFDIKVLDERKQKSNLNFIEKMKASKEQKEQNEQKEKKTNHHNDDFLDGNEQIKPSTQKNQPDMLFDLTVDSTQHHPQGASSKNNPNKDLLDFTDIKPAPVSNTAAQKRAGHDDLLFDFTNVSVSQSAPKAHDEIVFEKPAIIMPSAPKPKDQFDLTDLGLPSKKPEPVEKKKADSKDLFDFII